METQAFKSDTTGRLVRAPAGYWAFVPSPLPPEIEVTWQLAASISGADRALSELAGVARALPNPRLLIAPFVGREAVLSSRIEGTQASLTDLFFFEAAREMTPRVPDVVEVSNYVAALEHGLARLTDLPMSLRLIRELHGRLMTGVRGDHMTPGEFRRSQNWIGPPGCTLTDAVFVPPPPHEMMETLNAFEKYLHAESRLPPLVRLGLIHYQFEAIHPFLDGNGRIGRLLVILHMCADGLLPQPLLYLSAFFERHRDHYYRLLLAVSQEGRWAEWLTFFLNGIVEQSRDALRRGELLMNLRENYRSRLQTARASALPLQLVDALFRRPALTIGLAAKLLDVTWVAAQNNVRKLVRAGILEEATGRERNRVFVAREVLRVLEAESAEQAEGVLSAALH